jgi:hypothetical protein
MASINCPDGGRSFAEFCRVAADKVRPGSPSEYEGGPRSAQQHQTGAWNSSTEDNMPLLSPETTTILAIVWPVLTAFVLWCLGKRHYIIGGALGALIGVFVPHLIHAALPYIGQAPPIVMAALVGFGAAKLVGWKMPKNKFQQKRSERKQAEKKLLQAALKNGKAIVVGKAKSKGGKWRWHT